MRLVWISCLLAPAALAACDSVKPTFVDAAPTDAVIDVAIGPASITVLREDYETNPGTPVAGVHVWFLTPGGEAVMKTTGADGKASADVTPGSAIVTSHLQNATGTISRQFTAFVGIGPGADVIAGAKPRPTAGTSLGRATFTGTAFAGATGYSFVAPCASVSGSNLTWVADVQSNCPAANAATVVMFAYNAAGMIGYTTESNLNLTQLVNMTHAMPAFQAPSNATLTVNNLSAGTTQVTGELTFVKDGITTSSLYGSTQITGTTATVTGAMAPVGATTNSKIQVRATGQLMPMFHTTHASGAVLATTVDFAQALPFMTYPSFDPATFTVAWTASGNASHVPDALVARVSSYDQATATQTNYSIFGPGGLDHLSLPVAALPAELKAFLPPAGAQPYVNELWAIDVAGKDGFAAVAGTLDQETRDIYFDAGAFGDAPEVWFTGTLPL